MFPRTLMHTFIIDFQLSIFERLGQIILLRYSYPFSLLVFPYSQKFSHISSQLQNPCSIISWSNLMSSSYLQFWLYRISFPRLANAKDYTMGSFQGWLLNWWYILWRIDREAILLMTSWHFQDSKRSGDCLFSTKAYKNYFKWWWVDSIWA